MIVSPAPAWPKVVVLLTCILAMQGLAQEVQASSLGTPAYRPRIAIIIDDLGGSFDDGQRVIDLPGPVACAFLPFGRHTPTLAHIAHAQDKEVMLHLPMQAVERTVLGPGALTLDMSRQQVVSTVRENLEVVPHVSGVNNHMGSLLTRHPGHMTWLMEVLKTRSRMFFVDSRTTHETVAHRIAEESSVAAVSRDVFLDAQADTESVEAQFQRLIQIAQKKGSALAIGHPHEATLNVLLRELTALNDYGVSLVPVRRLATTQPQRK